MRNPEHKPVNPMIKPASVNTLCGKALCVLLLFLFMGTAKAENNNLLDSTIFKIKVLQDTVYVGDTVDVDLYIGDEGLLGILNILSEFEVEVGSDTSYFLQDKLQFTIDTASLTNFFGTVISNINLLQTIDITKGLINLKGNSSTLGNGNARMGRGQYIVQDNAAGKYMHFDYTKAVSKGLLGILNPVRTISDSVYVAERQVPTAVTPVRHHTDLKIYPNPSADYIWMEGSQIKQYRILDAKGKMVQAEDHIEQPFEIDLTSLSGGIYYLLVQTDKYWTSYKIIKQ